MVKAMVAVMVVAGAALGLVYFAGGFRSFDPTKQGRKAKAAITPGMTWTQVAQVAGDPKHYRVLAKVKKKSGGDVVEVIEPGFPMEFDRKTLAAEISANRVPNGFVFAYMFSQQAAFSVTFDGTGCVVGVEDIQTMADLLGTRDGG
jgi:hypothetical protein